MMPQYAHHMTSLRVVQAEAARRGIRSLTGITVHCGNPLCRMAFSRFATHGPGLYHWPGCAGAESWLMFMNDGRQQGRRRGRIVSGVVSMFVSPHDEPDEYPVNMKTMFP